jgi:hypothetical protein
MRFCSVCLVPLAPLAYVADFGYGLWQRRRSLWVSYGLTLLVAYHHTILSLERALVATLCCALGLALGTWMGVWWAAPSSGPVAGHTVLPCRAPVDDPVNAFPTATMLLDARGYLTVVCPRVDK